MKLNFLTIITLILTAIYSLVFAIDNASEVNDEIAMNKVASGTSITSDQLEMQSLDDKHVFTFKGNVAVDSEELHVTSDELIIFSNKEGNENTSDQPNTPGKIGKIERVVASGNVFIKEDVRTLKAGHAIIDTLTGEVTLEDNPIYEDADGIVTGYRMILRKGEKKAYVEPGNGERPKVVLPKLKNLNSAIDA